MTGVSADVDAVVATRGDGLRDRLERVEIGRAHV